MRTASISGPVMSQSALLLLYDVTMQCALRLAPGTEGANLGAGECGLDVTRPGQAANYNT
jgi:hypothetical protein